MSEFRTLGDLSMRIERNIHKNLHEVWMMQRWWPPVKTPKQGVNRYENRCNIDFVELFDT